MECSLETQVDEGLESDGGQGDGFGDARLTSHNNNTNNENSHRSWAELLDSVYLGGYRISSWLASSPWQLVGVPWVALGHGRDISAVELKCAATNELSRFTHTHWIDTVRVIVSLTLSSSPLTRKKNGRLKIPAENRQRVSPLKILDLIKMYKKRIGWHVKNQAPSTLSPDSMASPADAKIMWRNQAPQSQDKTSRRSVTSPSVECLNLDWLLAVVVVGRRRRRRRRQWVKRATGRYGSRGSDRVYSFIRSPWPRTPFSESRLLSSRACKLPFQLNRSYSCSHGEKIKKTTSFLSVSQL